MKRITNRFIKAKLEKERLDKEAQVFKCLVCDEEKVRWNGEWWECGECGFIYSETIVDSLIK